MLSRYRLENKELIARNMAKQTQEEKTIQRELARERREKQLRRDAYEKQAQDESRLKKREQLDVINQLAAAPTSANAEEIIAKSKKEVKKKAAFTKIKLVTIKVWYVI